MMPLGEGMHYYLAEPMEYQKCNDCGKSFRNIHNCNQLRVNYYQNQKSDSGPKYVKTINIKKPKKNLTDCLLVYDFETYINHETSKVLPYCVGFKTINDEKLKS
jgi:hypothetical protein